MLNSIPLLISNLWRLSQQKSQLYRQISFTSGFVAQPDLTRCA